jgi:hypothetical protein
MGGESMTAPPYPPAGRDARVAVAARWLALGLVPARLCLDAAWAVELRPGLTLGQALGSALALAALAVAAADVRALPPPARWVLGVVGGAVIVGAARAPSLSVAVSNALHLLAPFAVWAVARAAAEPAVVSVWRRVAWLPVGVSLAAWAAGQRGEVVLQGWPRLVGWYANVHSHAAAMAVIGASAGLAALASGRRRELPLAVASLACLALTFVRGGVLFVVVALLAGAPRSRWVRVGAAALVVGSLAVVADRWADLWSLATLEPPAAGWGALGSHRGRIWAESVAAFLSEPVGVQLLGRGLGGQYGLHRHLDPHNELLSLWFQLGPLGPVAWCAALVAAWRAARGEGAGEARGLLAGAAVLALVGNDVLYRPTLAWWVAGAAGLAAGVRPPAVSALRPSGDGAGGPPAA